MGLTDISEVVIDREPVESECGAGWDDIPEEAMELAASVCNDSAVAKEGNAAWGHKSKRPRIG